MQKLTDILGRKCRVPGAKCQGILYDGFNNLFRVIGCTVGTSLLCISLLLFMSACTDDFYVDDDITESGNGEFHNVTLPGYLSIRINTGASTRADIEDGFNDGDNNEYALAPGDHHYLILFNSTNSSSAKPWAVLPLSVEKTKLEEETDNITLTVRDAYSSIDFGQNNIKDLPSFRTFLNNNLKEAYALLNVDLTEGFSVSDKTIAENTSPMDILKDLTKEQLLTQSSLNYYSIKVNDKGEISPDGTEYFTMSTSTFVKNNAVTYGYKIDGDQVYEKREEALNFNNQPPTITCYVERLTAKYTFDFSELTFIGPSVSDEGDPTDDPTTRADAGDIIFTINTGSTVKVFDKNKDGGLTIGEESYEIPYNNKGWELQVMGYGLNGLEKSSQMIKNLTNNQYFDDVHEPGNWRSYWAEDNNYEISDNTLPNYPNQFRQSLEVSTFKVRSLHKAEYTEDGQILSGYTDDGNINVNKTNANACLEYFPYNSFLGKPQVIYSHENTFDNKSGLFSDKTKFTDRYYFTPGTHFILVGRININDITSGSNLYYDQNNIFYGDLDDLLENKLLIFNKIVLKEGNHGLRVLDVNWLHTPGYEEDTSIDGLTKIEWVKDAVLWVKVNNNWIEATAEHLRLIPAEILGGDGSMLIGPKADLTELCIAPAITGSDGSRTMDNTTANQTKIKPNLLISLFHKIIGPIDHFREGAVYYAHPIPQNINGNTYTYGVVRNNWYEIKVKSILGVGRSVDDVTQPIVPELQINRNYLNMTIKIADWHKISQDLEEDWL